jgi:hypothetical protein
MSEDLDEIFEVAKKFPVQDIGKDVMELAKNVKRIDIAIRQQEKKEEDKIKETMEAFKKIATKKVEEVKASFNKLKETW